MRLKLAFLALICPALIVTGCTKKSASATHIAVRMRQFAIEPAEIRVKRGENVVLDVTTVDVQHGFLVSQLGINEPVQPGKSTQIALDTSKSGEFKAECSVICGAGHDQMTAKIVVE